MRFNKEEESTAAPDTALAGSTADADLDTLLSSWRSPIFWRIAAVVFLCIIAIEAVLLVFSWYSERDRLLTRVDDSLAVLAPILAESDQIAELEWLLKDRQPDNRHPLLGYVLVQSDGKLRSNGNTGGLGKAVVNDTGGRFDSATGYYDSYLPIESAHGEHIDLWLRLDARHISDELQAYVLRIMGLVLLISMFVTVGSLLGLTPLLIQPLRKLNRLMQIGQSRGLRHVRAPAAELRRTDELGNVYRSFELLRCELIAADEENKRITERFQHFADLGADIFWEVDRHLVLTYAAGDISAIFGIDGQQMVGHSLRHFKQAVKEQLPDMGAVLRALQTYGFWEGALEGGGADEQAHSIRIVASALRDKNGVFIGARGTVTDVTVASELAKELKHQATHDALTGLYNRREFDRVLEHELHLFEESGKPLCVCMLDLDRFKIVNDSCGHAAGDLLLKQLSELIQQTVREYDVVARFGGDEFTVLLPGCDMENGMRVAENIRKVVDTYRFYWNDEVYNVGASIGIAETSPALNTAKAIVLAADSCCIKAKRLGRNQVQPYSENDDAIDKQHGQMQWMARITQALEEDHLLLYQQPIVPVSDEADDEIHFEVLLRMKDGEGSIFCPGEFLPAAERYSLIDKLDRWVVDHTIAWLAEQSIEEGTRLCVNINLSAMTVSDDQFQDYLFERLKSSDVQARQLCFEITESAAMKNTVKAIEFLQGIRELGCRIALDDFGTGFSSLSHIQELPLDYIKIDGVFIRDIAESRLDQALVKSVVDVAKILNVRTVAEFVESQAALAVLKELNIDYAQGYLFGAAEPLEDLSRIDCSQRAA